MKYKADSTESTPEVCSYFANFFKSVYSNDDLDLPETLSLTIKNNNTFNSLQLTANEIFKQCCSLELGKGNGPDGIPNVVLRSCSGLLAAPLQTIFNSSLKQGYFPKIWKISSISPIHKSGNRSDVENYRGISILSAIPKVFEAIVNRYFVSQIKNCIIPNQHGFTSGRSTTTNLLEFTSKVSNYIELGYQVDVIYFDFKKAFDRVAHKILVKVLDSYGFGGSMIEWLRSYLDDRRQYVQIGSSSSNIFNVKSGVPQGSHIGPPSFLLLVNGVDDVLDNVNYLVFADDMKLFHPISNVNDCHHLQKKIHDFCSWAKLFGLSLNVGKCKVMTYSRKRNPIIFDYKCNGTSIERVKNFKDLGVIFNTKLEFDDHISYIQSKASSMLGFIKRQASDFRDPYTLLTLYNSLVRSHLEYAAVVWSPYYEKYKNLLESIQNKFVRFAVRNLNWVSNPYQIGSLQLRNLLGVQTLESRRTIAALKLMHGVLSGNISSYYILEHLHMVCPTHNTRNRMAFRNSQHRSNYGKFEPLNNIVMIFNTYFYLFDFNTSLQQFHKILKLTIK